jgi:N-acetylglucosaminyldiphosphoundecaprenol N-acetyl-beta-D-mannosaminyltransferase
MVVTPNPEQAVAAWRDAEFAAAVAGASLALADGVGLVIASRLLGGPLGGRVTGVAFLGACLDVCAARGWPVFLLGGRPGVASEAARRAAAARPGLRVAGAHHGYFGADEAAGVLETVRAAAPRFLAVGMGHPRQELWLSANLPQLPGTLGLACGGSIDVLAGTVARAPGWAQRHGLEWLYRLLASPRTRLRRSTRLLVFGWRVVARRLLGWPFPAAKRRQRLESSDGVDHDQHAHK